MPQVLIRIDAAGEWPVLVEDDEALPVGDGVRWRYVCDVETRAEGNAVSSAWLSRRLSPDVRRELDEERIAAELEMRTQPRGKTPRPAVALARSSCPPGR